MTPERVSVLDGIDALKAAAKWIESGERFRPCRIPEVTPVADSILLFAERVLRWAGVTIDQWMGDVIYRQRLFAGWEFAEARLALRDLIRTAHGILARVCVQRQYVPVGPLPRVLLKKHRIEQEASK